LATGERKTVLGSVVKILSRYKAVPSRSSVTASSVNAYVTWITQTTIIIALSIDAIIALARAFALVIFDLAIYATLTSFKCFAYTLVTAHATGTYTYTYAIIATLISGTRAHAFPVITTFTAGACGYTSALVTAFPHLITDSTISVSTTLFIHTIIAGCIITTQIANGATAQVTIAALALTTVFIGRSAAFGFTRITLMVTTTQPAPTTGAAALLSGGTASVKTTVSIATDMIDAAAFGSGATTANVITAFIIATTPIAARTKPYTTAPVPIMAGGTQGAGYCSRTKERCQQNDS